jgi:hypothetical protein
MFAVGIAFIGLLVVGAAVALLLRKVVFTEAAIEEDLRRAGTHILTYEVPRGEDPTLARTALMHAGFECISELRGGQPVLQVLCENATERDVASRVLQHG